MNKPCNLPSFSQILTHWGRDKMAAISQTILSNAFSWMKMFEFRLKFHWKLFLRVQLTIFQHWLRWWLGAWSAPSHYLNQWWLDYRRISLGFNELRNKQTMFGYWQSIIFMGKLFANLFHFCYMMIMIHTSDQSTVSWVVFIVGAM